MIPRSPRSPRSENILGPGGRRSGMIKLLLPLAFSACQDDPKPLVPHHLLSGIVSEFRTEY
jgi:hypothetical protein